MPGMGVGVGNMMHLDNIRGGGVTFVLRLLLQPGEDSDGG